MKVQLCLFFAVMITQSLHIKMGCMFVAPVALEIFLGCLQFEHTVWWLFFFSFFTTLKTRGYSPTLVEDDGLLQWVSEAY